MNEFVEECRREWERLGVPDPIAHEMAADLQADLLEAEAEGGSPEDVLGNGAFDARAFAAAWATERGVVGPSVPRAPRAARRWWLAPAIVVFAVVAVIGLALLLSAPHRHLTRVAIAPVTRRVQVLPQHFPLFRPPRFPLIRPLPFFSEARQVALGAGDSGVDVHLLGGVLLLVGLAGGGGLTLYWRVRS